MITANNLKIDTYSWMLRSDNGLLDKSRHLHLDVKEEASSFMRLDDKVSQDVYR